MCRKTGHPSQVLSKSDYILWLNAEQEKEEKDLSVGVIIRAKKRASKRKLFLRLTGIGIYQLSQDLLKSDLSVSYEL